uniref:Uncharacterized protein n=1 Tax=Solanum tuberosum TaxID=4113 RepID=M1DWS9_SOLTU
MAAFKAVSSSVDPWLCSHIAILAARTSMVVLRDVIASVKAIRIMPGIEASRLADRQSAERVSCPIRSRDAQVSGSWESAATVVGLGDHAVAEEPGESAVVTMAMDILEGPGVGVNSGASAGDDYAFTSSIDAAILISA